ncbi:MAG: phage portal protein [Bacillota bacterium]|nr:phage portal protein [Bacillota bacterium]
MRIPLLSKIFRSRASPRNSMWGSAYTFFFGTTSSGKTVNERTAMQTTAVYACVRVLAEVIASLPLHTYRHTENGKEKALDHSLYYLLHSEPNPEMTSFVFRETLMGHLLLWGNGYAQIIRDGRGKVIALYPLMPDKMTVERSEKGELFYLYNKDGTIYLLRSDEVLHIPGLGFDGLICYSPIAMAKNAIGMAIATEEYGAKFFANGANPGGVLEHPGVVKDLSKIRESWNAVYQGSGNAHRIAVLEEGMKFQSIGIPPEQAQFLETRKFQLNEIARIFRVPPHMVGDLERSSFSNIEQQSASQIYTMLKEYPGKVTVKIEGIAASAASVIAMAADEVLMSPVAMMMIHNPATVVFGEVAGKGKVTFGGTAMKPAAGQADSTTSTVSALKNEVNALMVKLQEAGKKANGILSGSF